MKTRHKITSGDALDLHFIDDDSVDLVVTSPPYFGQREYLDSEGNVIKEAVGSEATIDEYLTALDRFMDEAWRVIKPTGSVFVNLGDKYEGSGGHNNANIAGEKWDGEKRRDAPTKYVKGSSPARRKSLMGLPWRFAIRQIDRGWVLRAEIVWNKPNGMPESVTDRVRRGHEQWFHFTKEEKYYAAIDELREPHEEKARKQSTRAKQIAEEHGLTNQHLEAARAVGLSDVGSAKSTQSGSGKNSEKTQRLADEAKKALGGYFREFLGADTAKLGKLPVSVQRISTGGVRPTKEERETYNLPDHFAPFPAEWPRFFILGWSPKAWCGECGEPVSPVVEKTKMEWEPSKGREEAIESGSLGDGRTTLRGTMKKAPTTTILGYSCPNDHDPSSWTPSIILDPFAGTGTTAIVSSLLDRSSISVDLSPAYVRLMKWRVRLSDHEEKLARKWKKKGLI